MEIRPAKADDFMAFFGKSPTTTVRALVALDDDGKPMAIGGYYLFANHAVAFTDHRKGMTKRQMIKGARAVVAMLKELKVSVIAVAGVDGTTALKHYGFEPAGNGWRMR